MIITHVCARVIVQIYCRRSQFARGTGGCSRCWDWRQHAAAVCVGVSESGGGGAQTVVEFGRFHTRAAAVC